MCEKLFCLTVQMHLLVYAPMGKQLFLQKINGDHLHVDGKHFSTEISPKDLDQ